MAALVAGGFFAHRVFADDEPNVFGWAWSANIGWLSFNSVNIDPENKSYGVNIDEGTGIMSGYAWSENIGWVSFNAADLAGCPSGACEAKVDTACAGGNCEVSGWARVISACQDSLWNGANCTGGGAGDKAGGWNGFIKLRGADYGVYIDPATKDFRGWAWSDMVLGWLSFNSEDAGGGPYKVHTTANIGLNAKMECGGTECVYGTCDNNPGAAWVAYPPIQRCPACIYSITNKSTGSFSCSYWRLSGPADYVYKGTGAVDEKINLSAFAGNIIPGSYTLSLTVSDIDSADCSTGNSKINSRAITIKQGILANFVCALGNPIYDEDENPDPAPWQDCTSTAGKADFGKRAVKGGTIYVKDVSTPSESAPGIIDHTWRFTVDGGITVTDGEIASFTTGKDNKIELYSYDDGTCPGGSGCANCRESSFRSRVLPKWEEVPI